MSENSGQTLAEGWWCEGCEFFESDDDVDVTKGICIGCGCAGSAHIPVEVVGK